MSTQAKRTKLMEAYISLTEGYNVDTMNIDLVKEEFESIIDTDISDEEFMDAIIENAKVYKVYLRKFKPNKHSNFMELNGIKYSEISIEAIPNSEYY